MEKSSLTVDYFDALNLKSTLLKGLLIIWQDKLHGREMPCRKDFDPLELPASMWPHIILIDVLHGDPERFRYRLIGTHVVDALSRDVTGQIIDEIQSRADYDVFVEGFRWVVENHRPMQSNGSANFVNKKWMTFESLILPLSEDGSTVNMLMVATVFTLDQTHNEPLF